jgi:hypothetical protein
MSDVALRAERLRLFIAVIGEEPTMRAYESATYGFVPGGWDYYMAGDNPADFPDDFHLAWECASLGQEIRDRQWAALQALGAAWAAGDGATAPERIASMPAHEARRALIAAHDLGWHFPMPDRDEEA